MQPLYKDKRGVIRFRGNRLVEALLDWGQSRGMGLNELTAIGIGKREDWQQPAQLIGYSLDGYFDLSYVTGKGRERAERAEKKFRRASTGSERK